MTLTTEWLLVLGALALLLLWLGAHLANRWRHFRERALRQARWTRSQVGEQRARQLLLADGFEIMGEQVERTWTLRVGEAHHTYRSRVDFLVRRQGRVYVADAKTGNLVTSPRSPATRRQLLEYQLAFGADGVLLVDAEAERVLELVFPWQPEPAPQPFLGRWLGWGLVFALGLAVGFWLAQTR